MVRLSAKSLSTQEGSREEEAEASERVRGTNYPKELQRLILALLLHDFVHTEKHQSKIYEQVTIEDEELREVCLKHHAENNSNNDLLVVLQYYDGLASGIAQKKPYKHYSRCVYEEGKIDFKALAQAIEEHQQFAYKLYQFIYHSQDLERTVKSMNYEDSLRNHLLLMVNLAINDYYARRLVISHGKLRIIKTKSVSSSATEGEEIVLSAMDVEIHPSPTMNNADSESPSNSMKEKENLGGKSR